MYPSIPSLKTKRPLEEGSYSCEVHYLRFFATFLAFFATFLAFFFAAI